VERLEQRDADRGEGGVATIAWSRRRDRDDQQEIGAGYQFPRSTRVFVGYNQMRRRSNVDLADYAVDRVSVRIEMGWM